MKYWIVIKLFTAESRKKILFLFLLHFINVSCLPTENYLPGAWERIRKCRWPCIIILTRGRNELFFRIIFKEKVIFCSLYFFLPCDANETNAFIFRCQLWQIVWKIINQKLRPSSLTSSITIHIVPQNKNEKKNISKSRIF